MSEHDQQGPGETSGAANFGVQQYGGQSSVTNQAIGPNARAVAGRITVHAPGGDQQRAQVEQLIQLVERLLEEHRAVLPDQEAPRVELRRLREELEEGEPEPGVVRRALTRLAAFAEPAAPLAAAVAELTRAVGGF
ncbi:DUF5955 family protein [Streptomyces thermolilacinus]|uniref:Uncharacterized protein n=1 Tax=Streptomyces thermolilacinus SPC6 TaxID=1306406 RepID=A0A1D3DYM8_9ACTN|nr:DUF5955 family protein [Streptomyces thermolilacinus]OEJ97430.1 hypothetical protein J116_026225 [Streptomyces thermolilacinus SPC6]